MLFLLQERINALEMQVKLSTITINCLLQMNWKLLLPPQSRLSWDPLSIDPQQLSKGIKAGFHRMTSVVDRVMVLQQGLLLKSG